MACPQTKSFRLFDSRRALRLRACLAIAVVFAACPPVARADPTPLTVTSSGGLAPVQADQGHGHKKKKGAAPGIAAVSIRAGDHKGLSRVLISWPSASTYKVDEAPGTVTITFDRPAKPDLGNTAKQVLRNIQSIATVDDPQHLIVKLTVKSGARSRAFKTGNIVIVDIFDGGTGTVEGAPAPVTASATSGEKTEGKPEDAVIHLQPADAAASLAVFRRGPYLWLATDGKGDTRAPTVAGPLAKDLGQPTQYSASGGTLYRYVYKPDEATPLHISTRQHSGGWDIVFSANAAATPPLAVKAIAAETEVTIAAPGAAHVLSFTDPDLGDTLDIVPLPTAGAYIDKMRRYADADLLPTVQGVAAVTRSEHAQIGAGLGAVTISGIVLSTDSGSGGTAPALFELDAWYAGGPSQILANRRKIEHAALGEDAPGERTQAIEMARLFLANGWGYEAGAALSLAQSADPDVVKSPDFIALRGGAAALALRVDDATADLGSDALRSQPEALVWRALAETAGTSDQRQEAFSILRSNTAMFAKYPHELKQRFALALASLAVEANEPVAMDTALTLLTKGESPDRTTKPAIATLKAGIAAQKGKFGEADKQYASVPAWRDQYWTAVAGLAAVENGLAQGTLQEKDAIDRLDALRFDWRGDDYENRVLEKLGELYLATGDYKKGLDTLTNLITVGAGSKYADEAKQKVIDTAKLAFSAEKAASTSPLDTFELYNTFVPYLPPRTIPDSDVRALSDRLAALGVMDQAIGLIQPQMDAATDPSVKARLGGRIAALRLLDDKPDLALKSLAASDSDKIDDTLKTERKLLLARALFKSGKSDEANAALQGLSSREADALRVEIAWPQKDWKGAAAALGRLAGQPDAAGNLTDEQANIVLNEAVALNLGNDAVTLDQLNKTYGAAMAKSKKASSFALLTSPASDTKAPSIESVKASVSSLDIFENFLSAYRKDPGKA